MSIKVTDDYSKFKMLEENRDVDLEHPRTKNLAESMVDYGWLDSFPATVKPNGSDKMIVIDGQHRIAIAKEFGLPVKYVIETRDIDIPKLQQTSKSWALIDYVKSFAKAGNPDYQELLEFFQSTPLTLTSCASFLADTSTFANITKAFHEGRYRIKARHKANQVASIYRIMIEIQPHVKNQRFTTALWSVYHVPGFDANRLIEGARRKPGLLICNKTLEGFLDALEETYNFGRKDKTPLRFEAKEAMKARSLGGKHFRSDED